MRVKMEKGEARRGQERAGMGTINNTLIEWRMKELRWRFLYRVYGV